MSIAPVGLVGAAGGDPQSLLTALADGARRVLPGGGSDSALAIERDRSLGDRLAGRPGRVSSLRLTGPDAVMTLRAEAGGAKLVGEAAKVVRGVAISRRTLALGEWLGEFAGQVAALAAEAAGDAAAAARALGALGLRPAGADLAVDENDVSTGLASLVMRVRGRVPVEAEEAVARIVDLLRDALPRVVGDIEGQTVVHRTATLYLPDTLRAYVALPADWARTHVLSDGSTAAQALLVQLADLEQAARGMRDAAVEQDASALLVNGRFLADRFATSSLDLPG